MQDAICTLLRRRSLRLLSNSLGNNGIGKDAHVLSDFPLNTVSQTGPNIDYVLIY